MPKVENILKDLDTVISEVVSMKQHLDSMWRGVNGSPPSRSCNRVLKHLEDIHCNLETVEEV